jgi:hypothetical protein
VEEVGGVTAHLIQEAKAWAHRGFHVFPVEVYWDAIKGKWMKVPRTPRGFRDASDRIARVVPMFNAARILEGGTIGIGCCPGWSGYAVADIDDEDAYDRLLDELGDVFEGAAEVLTPSGGSHRWFRHPGGVVDNTDLVPGINMRGDNGFVLLPGFAGYELEVSSVEIPEVSVVFPRALRDRIAENKKRAAIGDNPSVVNGKVAHPGRNPFLFSIGSSLKYKGLPYEVIEAVLSVVNEMMCDPPHVESEVRRAARDAFRSNPTNPKGDASRNSGHSLDTWLDQIRKGRGGRT